MGLRDGHPEKEGVLVDLEDLVSEVKQRMKRKANIDAMAQQAEGLRVVGGTRGEGAMLEAPASTEPDKAAGKENESPNPSEAEAAEVVEAAS